MMHFIICNDLPEDTTEDATIEVLVFRIDNVRLERALYDALHDLGLHEARFLPMFKHCAVITTFTEFITFEANRLDVIGSILVSAGYEEPFADIWRIIELNPFWMEGLEARDQMNQFTATMH